MTRSWVRLAGTLLVTAAVAVATPARAGTGGADAGLRAAAQPADWPARQALERISRLDSFTVFDWITARYDRGTLTLEGFATRPVLKARAEEEARRVAGVEAIVNAIEVLPALQGDNDLRLRAFVAIYGHPALVQYSPHGGVWGLDVRELESAAHFGLEASTAFRGPQAIHIVVASGSVQLFGRVVSTLDRQVAEAQVRTLPGVIGVVNHIEVSRR